MFSEVNISFLLPFIRSLYFLFFRFLYLFIFFSTAVAVAVVGLHLRFNTLPIYTFRYQFSILEHLLAIDICYYGRRQRAFVDRTVSWAHGINLNNFDLKTIHFIKYIHV